MNTRQLILIFTAIALVASPLSGCLKGDDPVKAANVEQEKADDLLGDTGQKKLEDLAATIPKDYTFPGQNILPKVSLSLPGTVSSEALGSYEAQRDEGGMEYRTVYDWKDVSAQVPVGQPVEMFIKLFWDGAEMNSADLDIAVDVPGLNTDYSDVTEDFNWNYASKSMVVNTIGVTGMPMKVGIQAAGGAVSQGFDYRLDITFTYVKNVLTPHHPWKFNVPEGASGVILESESAGGDEHVSAEFIVIGPDDKLVTYKAYNDIDVPTQSIFIPTKSPGDHIFYAYSMHGGFLRMKADVPLETFTATPLALVSTHTVDIASPAPGVAGKNPLEGTLADGSALAGDINPTSVPFDTGETFPLRVFGTITGQVNTEAKITLKSPTGTVHTLTKILRYEDESGSIGYTSDREGSPNNKFAWENIQRGAWTAEIVNDGPTEIGHTLVTYQR